MTNKSLGFEITNPDKILYKKGKITKADVINYYNDISSLMLKELKNRPISVFRCHENACGDCFFKKHPTTEGELIGKTLIDGEDYFYISNKTQLLYQVQMGTIEFHTWGCKVPNIEKPDLIVFDLDPAEDVSLAKLRKGTLYLKEILDSLNLKSSIKTSGGKGYHILVPLKNKNWQEFSEFASQVAQVLEAKYPDYFTTNIRKNMRTGKIFVDYLRNKRGASCVAAYSLRARENAPISFPIEWNELDKIKPNEVNIKNYKNYLKVM